MFTRFINTLAILGTLALFVVASGCDSTDAMEEAETMNPDEVASSIAVASAAETGGAADQALDAAAAIEVVEASKVAGKSSSTSYDAETKTWTIDLDRSYEGPAQSATFSRRYRVQFLDANGAPMASYQAGGKMASSLLIDVLDGGAENFGTYSGPSVEGNHEILSGSLRVDGIDTDTYTINGSGTRSGLHTITRNRYARDAEHDMSLTLTDLVVQPDAELRIRSGVISGTYEARVHVIRGERERGRDVSVAYTITFEDGVGTIEFSGGGELYDGTTFQFDAQTGVLR